MWLYGDHEDERSLKAYVGVGGLQPEGLLHSCVRKRGDGNGRGLYKEDADIER